MGAVFAGQAPDRLASGNLLPEETEVKLVTSVRK